MVIIAQYLNININGRDNNIGKENTSSQSGKAEN